MKLGYAEYKRGKLYFDEIGWSMVRQVAKRLHKTPHQVVISALKRYIKYGKNKKSK